MLKVGLTGGIGSGKSTVARIFALLGVPVYIADLRAHRIMMSDASVQQQIIALLGSGAYLENGLPDRRFIASKVFADDTLLQGLNAIIHPAVRTDFAQWCAFQEAPYVIQEAAVLFESGGDALMDEIILVWAPEEERIRRVAERDGISRDDVFSRMRHQWPDQQKATRAQFVINNDGAHPLLRQVMDIHAALSALSVPDNL